MAKYRGYFVESSGRLDFVGGVRAPEKQRRNGRSIHR